LFVLVSTKTTIAHANKRATGRLTSLHKNRKPVGLSLQSTLKQTLVLKNKATFKISTMPKKSKKDFALFLIFVFFPIKLPT